MQPDTSNKENVQLTPSSKSSFTTDFAVQSSSKSKGAVNLSDFFVECESFDKGICALKMFKGSFTFSFESDIDELKLNLKKLEQDIEICKKVQYAILCKFILE